MIHSRRQFLRSQILLAGSAFALPSLIQAAKPWNREGKPRLRLSLAAYSFRQYLEDKPNAREKRSYPDRKLTMEKFIDYAAEQNCDAVELTSYYFPKDANDEYFRSIKRHLFLRGVEVSGTAVGNTFALAKGKAYDQQVSDVKAWIDRAAIFGAPHIRVFAGEAKNVPADEAMHNVIAGLEECGDYAGKKGIFLGVENHGGIVAEAKGLLEIIQAVNSPWVGINLDTGNFRTNDPYADLEKCAPYAVNVQIKEEIKQSSSTKAEPADLQRMIGILRAANYQGYVALEYESAQDPWDAVPRLLGKIRELIQA